MPKKRPAKKKTPELPAAMDWQHHRSTGVDQTPTLQIMDSATWDAMKALAKTGMISIHTRARRSLLTEEGETMPPPLTPEELARIKALRETAEKKRRAAEALITAGLHEEAEPFKKEALCADARLVIELDGMQHLQDAMAWRSDRQKDLLLQRHGYMVMRILTTDIAKNLAATLDSILATLEFCDRKNSSCCTTETAYH